MFIIINPAAAGGKTRARWAKLEAHLKAAGLRFDATLTEGPLHATALAAQAAAQGYATVACMGGDGTVNEVVNGLMQSERRPTLAVIPAGTGSDLARMLKLPHAPQAVAALLQTGTPQKIDVGLVICQRAGQTHPRYFINIAGLGFDGDVSAQLNRGDKRGGNLAYFASVFKVLGRYKNKRAAVYIKNGIGAAGVAGEQCIEGVFNSIVVANGQYFGGGMQVAPQAVLTDGLLDVVLIGDVSRAEFIAAFPKIYRGAHLTHPKVKTFRATEVRIEAIQNHPSEPAMLEAEGELFGQAPARITVLPGALNILVL